MTFQLSIRGGSEMNYRMEEKNPFEIVGIMKRVPIVFEGENLEINAMWNMLDSGKIKQITELSDI